LLSILLIVVFPKIVNSIKSSSKSTDDLSEKLIYNAAKLYVERYKNDYTKENGNIYCITLKELVEEKYLVSPITLSDGKDISDIKTVEVIYQDGFSYLLKENSECVEVKNTVYADNTGAVVEVPEGLTPVIYSDNEWKVADTTQPWYNYNNQEWANTVILNVGVTKNVGDTIDVSNEIKGMFVYIPRYEYKIEGQYGTHIDGTSGTAELPGEIEVNFISKTQTTASSEYRIHPAFKFGDTELNGIWVGKFETIAQKFNKYINNSNIDAHMSKNSEWGAVAYLSQSLYGKYGNNDYIGAKKEVMINNCSTGITGIGADYQNASYTASVCAINTYTTLKGKAASTTGNITGVYDMSGGQNEWVMGVYNASISSSGFAKMPSLKYYDNYTSGNAGTACNSGVCYGHALGETNGWYNDLYGFVNSNSPWFVRGGYNRHTFSAGIFFSSYGTGGIGSQETFRVVITNS